MSLTRWRGAETRRHRRTAALAGLLAGASSAAFAAEASPAGQTAPQRSAPPAAAATALSPLVVPAAPRLQPGAVVGDVKPEAQLNPAEIQSYGVSTVTDLIDELAPQIESGQGRGDGPVILLNGRPISGLNEIRNIPTEAILRVDILPEEAALKYGYPPNQKVVNVVLRRRFRSTTAEAVGGAPTEGGQTSGQGELDHVRLRGEERLNLDLKVLGTSALTEDERAVVAPAGGAPYTLAGTVSSPVRGGEIDPALSALAGRTLTTATAPSATAGTPTLADFAAATAAAVLDDIGRYRTLSAASRQATANAVWAKPVARGFTVTANATLDAAHSASLQGLPALRLRVPAGDPFLPFAGPVLVARYVDTLAPLHRSSDSWGAHLGGTLNGQVSSWRVSLTGAYDHADSHSRAETGVDPAPLQALLDAGSPRFNPFANIAPALVTLRSPNTADTRSDSFTARLLLAGPLLKVPAGRLFASLRVADTASWLSARSTRLGVVSAADLSRNDLGAQLSLDLPVAKKSAAVLPYLGDLSLNANASLNSISGFGTLNGYGYGLNWTPIPGLSLIVSNTREETAPTVQQLGGPLTLTPGARLFDFATGQTVDVLRIDGGDPRLLGDRRDVLKVGLNFKPFSKLNLTLVANYVASRTRDPIETFPAATAAIEAAFPERFVRDANGELVQVDFRPVNFAREDRRQLRWGLNFTQRIGPPPRPRFDPALFGPGPPGARRPGEGGRFRRGADGGTSAPPQGAARQDASPQQASPQQARPRGGPDGRADAGGTPLDPGPAGREAGGGFRGGRRGFAPPGDQGGQLQFAIYHTVVFEDRFRVRPGGPVLDLLNGAAAGSGGGQPRHKVEVQAGLTLNGLGARVSANWQSGTTVRGTGSAFGDLTFSDLATVNLRLFANLENSPGAARRHPWLSGTRITLSVTNLLDQRVRVRDASGATPLSYQPAYLDPVGRVVRISLRKLFV